MCNVLFLNHWYKNNWITLEIRNVSILKKNEGGPTDRDSEDEEESTKYLQRKHLISDVYHSVQNEKGSQFIYTNVAEIKLIPDSFDVKLVDIKVELYPEFVDDNDDDQWWW